MHEQRADSAQEGAIIDATIKKLRFKLVTMIMVVMTLLIVVVFTAICVMDYQRALNDVYADLDNAIASSRISQSDIANDEPADKKGPRIEFGGKGKEHTFIPVSVYSFADAGPFTLISPSSPYTLSDDVLENAIQSVRGAEEGNGSLPGLGLLYAKRNIHGTSVVAFTDESAASSWQTLLQTLVPVGLCTLAVLFVISLLFSKWALRPVKEAWDKQQRFISDASHELKTPLTVLSANMSILQKNMDKTIASESQWVESSQEELANMRELVDEMLFIASASEATPQRTDATQLEPQDLSKLVRGQVLQFESLAYENNIEFDSEIEDDISLPGDQARLQRLTRTLLDNACKYSGAGEKVNVRLAHEANDIVLQVANSGEHIPEEDLPHIFERFYRADKARVRESGSYGLGLSIAYDIAQEHGGQLSAASSPKEGTVFTVRWKANDAAS